MNSLLKMRSLRHYSLTANFTSSLNKIKHPGLLSWIENKATILQPDKIHVCSGTQEEAELFYKEMIQKGTLIPLTARPGSYLCRSDPSDVARVETRTFVCWRNKEDSGPNNNWEEPFKMRSTLHSLLTGAMRGRTMYVVPFMMGQPGSPFSKVGVELTDSQYAVINMRIMTIMGDRVLQTLGKNGEFIRCTHTVGSPLSEGKADAYWPCNDLKYIVHYPESREIQSFGSGYGGNSLLGKKCLALRIASIQGREEGWMAEHMLILGITNPEGKKRYIAAAFPSACGKTNLALLKPTIPGWKVETIGDDIAWLRIGKDGRLYAVNPEAGFFGVAPGTSQQSNSTAIETISKGAIFTNVALTDDGDVWWEGLTKKPPSHLTDWKGLDWTPECGRPAAHPNSRFTTPISQCPTLDHVGYNSKEGVPISAILFGGRRAKTIPLVTEALDWSHGVLMGASISSEQTAAAEGKIGNLRHDPFAMLPFCGYNMGDYFNFWNEFRNKTDKDKLPKLFSVNWFRKDENGKFIWPGFGDNIRVLKWIFERCDGVNNFVETPIGNLPKKESLDLSNLKITDKELSNLLTVDKSSWQTENQKLREYFKQYGSRLPSFLTEQLDRIDHRLK